MDDDMKSTFFIMLTLYSLIDKRTKTTPKTKFFLLFLEMQKSAFSNYGTSALF